MSELRVTDKLLNEDVFWNIIALSLKNSSNIDEQNEFLKAEIEKLTTENIIGFKLTLEKLTNNIHTSEMWCAAYLLNGGCSDDGFDYFKNWIVSRGKEIYYKAKENPDNLVECINEDEEYEFEELDYVAVEAFENKTGKDLYDYLPENLRGKTNFEFNWDEDNDESMKAICPKIFIKVEW